MNSAGGSGLSNDPRIEEYLARLRRGLAGVSKEKASDIVEELRSHILEKAATASPGAPGAAESVLSALGPPEDLAARYLADDLLERAEQRRSPVLLIRGLVRWAGLSAGGVFVLLGCLTGYFLGGSLMLCGLLKPIHPHTAGLWRLADQQDAYALSLRMGFEAAPLGGRELLGWWMLPLGLLLGGGLCLLTTLFVLWCAREFRRSHAKGLG
jgi:hypothetical protein